MSVVSSLGAALAAAVVTFIAVRVGEARCPEGLRDRSADAKGKPRIGGLAILAGLLVALPFEPDAWRFLVPTFLAGAIGLHDDLTDSSPVGRLLALAALSATAAALCFGDRGTDLGAPFFAAVFYGPVVLAVVVGFDFVDGLDGLASGVALVALTPLLWITPSPLLAAAVGAVAIYVGASNRPPARTLLGDAGSNALGMLVGLAVIDATTRPGAESAAALGVVAIPLLDLATTVIRRLRAGDLTSSERGHMHHKLLALHGRQDLAVLELLGVATICAGAGVVGTLAPSRGPDAVLGGAIALAILLFRTRATRPAPPDSR